MSGPDPHVALKLGLAVFPLPQGAKAPVPAGWQQTATRTPDLDTWPTGANIGVGCWRSQIVVLDLDVPSPCHSTTTRGTDSLAAAAAAHGQPWPATLTVTTPSGGSHLYYRAPQVVIGSTSGGKTMLGPGIDTRGPGAGGRGGYVVGPGSLIDGIPYAITDDRPMTVLPAWITRLLSPAARAGGCRAS